MLLYLPPELSVSLAIGILPFCNICGRQCDMKISTWIFPLALLLSYPTSADADTLEAAGECLAGFISWLKQWQTLTAGVLALIAAWAAWKQLDFQRKESKSRQWSSSTGVSGCLACQSKRFHGLS